LLRSPRQHEDNDDTLKPKASLAPSDFAKLEERLEHVLGKLDQLDQHVRCVPQLQRATFHAGLAIGALVVLLVIVWCLHASDTCHDAARAMFSLFVMISIASVNAYRWKSTCESNIDRLYHQSDSSNCSAEQAATIGNYEASNYYANQAPSLLCRVKTLSTKEI